MGCLHHLFGANFAPNFAPKVSPLACHFSLLFLNRSQNLSHSFWTSLVQYTTSTLEPRVAISQSRNRKCKHLNLECGHYHGQPNLVWYDFERFQTIYCTIELLPDVKTELEQWATTYVQHIFWRKAKMSKKRKRIRVWDGKHCPSILDIFALRKTYMLYVHVCCSTFFKFCFDIW